MLPCDLGGTPSGYIGALDRERRAAFFIAWNSDREDARDGAEERLTCRAVLLANNGFGGDRALVNRWPPEMRDAIFAGHAGNDGSARAFGEALGAATADLGAYRATARGRCRKAC